MSNKYDIVLFDLDGTILDTSEGIFNSVRYTENKMNLKAISDSDLRKFVGPPSEEMYEKTYNLSKEDAKLAAYYHRDYGRQKAIYEAKPYQGIEMCLEKLREAGYKLGVATLKAQDIAVTILKRFNLAKYFDVISGVDSNGTLTKKNVINNACQTIGEGKTVLVGDTIYDLKGALEAGVDFLPVLYGFGFSNVEELVDKKIVGISFSTQQIFQILTNNKSC